MSVTDKPTIAYAISEAAAAVGVSVSALRLALREGELVARYPTHGTGKPVVMYDDLLAWVANAPTERRTA